MKTTNFGSKLRNLVLAGVVAAASAGALAAPALARDWDHGRDGGWGHERDWRDRDDRAWVAPSYGYTYAYAPYATYGYAVPAPAPVYAVPPVISFGFSFR